MTEDQDKLAENDPLLHTFAIDALDETHPRAHSNIHCDRCGEIVHAANNEFMCTWVEVTDHLEQIQRGNYCLQCFAKADRGFYGLVSKCSSWGK